MTPSHGGLQANPNFSMQLGLSPIPVPMALSIPPPSSLTSDVRRRLSGQRFDDSGARSAPAALPISSPRSFSPFASPAERGARSNFSFAQSNFCLTLALKDVKLPTKAMHRRLKLWSLTEGFLFSSPKEMNIIKFAVALEKTKDDPLVSLSSIDVGVLADWNELIDVLRNCEHAHDEKTLAEHVLLSVEATLDLSDDAPLDAPKPPRPALITITPTDSIAAIANKVQAEAFFVRLKVTYKCICITNSC